VRQGAALNEPKDRGYPRIGVSACLALEAQLGAEGLQRAAAACVARGNCGAEYLLLFAGAEPALAVPDVPDQTAVDRDLAIYEAFVGR
jgi:hypothetical protein